ncbi:hypothetical protein DIPPA_11927 [Diplonema papillatum]|nr:hypothetical protein DIPPA_11927 [Diplonema papillatum]
MDSAMDEMLQWWLENDALGEKLENFVGKHCAKFAEPKEDGSLPEQTPEFMELYSQYKKLIESEMENFLSAKKIKADDFFEACAKKQGTDDEPAFLAWILAATDYEHFWRTMIDEKSRS